MGEVIKLVIEEISKIVNELTALQIAYLIVSGGTLVLEKVILPYLKEYIDNDYDSDNPYKPLAKKKYIVLFCIYLSLEIVFRCFSLPEYTVAGSTNSGKLSDTTIESAEPMNVVEQVIIKAKDEIISIKYLKTLTSEELCLIRNGIYAYEGRIFVEKEFMSYYEQYEWYEPLINPEDFREDYLNEFQHKNIGNILKIEYIKNSKYAEE